MITPKQVKLALKLGGKPGDVPKFEPVTAERINSREFPRIAVMDTNNVPFVEVNYVTNPTHGGKVTCHKCNGFILEDEHIPYWGRTETNVIAHFHKDCFNHYEHYYGLDKPIG